MQPLAVALLLAVEAAARVRILALHGGGGSAQEMEFAVGIFPAGFDGLLFNRLQNMNLVHLAD